MPKYHIDENHMSMLINEPTYDIFERIAYGLNAKCIL